MVRVPYYEQEREYTCGPASARMVLASVGVKRKEHHVAQVLKTKKQGTYDKAFLRLVKKYKVQCVYKRYGTLAVLQALQKKGYKIIISYWYSPEKVGHYAVLKKIGRKYVYLLDPWLGPEHKYSLSYFKKVWGWKHCAHPDRNVYWFFAVKK